MTIVDRLPLARKVIVVTGAGRGIGAACARGVAALGASVLVNDVDREAGDAVTREIVQAGGAAVADHCDIGKWPGGRAAIAACLAAFGRIDGLVNNAGIMRVDPVEDIRAEDLDAMLAVNVVGVIGCSVHAIEAMKRQGGSGAIVNITSGAHAGQRNLAAYGATKGAVASFTYGCAVDLAETPIRVNAVSPVGETRMREVMDDFRRGHDIPASRDAGPSAANNVPLIAFLLSDVATRVRGQVFRVNGPDLSVLCHPAILATVRQPAGWTFATVAAAFAEALMDRQQPLGLLDFSRSQ